MNEYVQFQPIEPDRELVSLLTPERRQHLEVNELTTLAEHYIRSHNGYFPKWLMDVPYGKQSLWHAVSDRVIGEYGQPIDVTERINPHTYFNKYVSRTKPGTVYPLVEGLYFSNTYFQSDQIRQNNIINTQWLRGVEEYLLHERSELLSMTRSYEMYDPDLYAQYFRMEDISDFRCDFVRLYRETDDQRWITEQIFPVTRYWKNEPWEVSQISRHALHEYIMKHIENHGYLPREEYQKFEGTSQKNSNPLFAELRRIRSIFGNIMKNTNIGTDYYNHLATMDLSNAIDRRHRIWSNNNRGSHISPEVDLEVILLHWPSYEEQPEVPFVERRIVVYKKGHEPVVIRGSSQAIAFLDYLRIYGKYEPDQHREEEVILQSGGRFNKSGIYNTVYKLSTDFRQANLPAPILYSSKHNIYVWTTFDNIQRYVRIPGIHD